MPSPRPKKFHNDWIGNRFPAFLWPSLARVHKCQSPSVCCEDRELLEHLVTVHPMKGLPDCRDSKQVHTERNVLCPRPQPFDVVSTLRCGQTPPLGDHVGIWIDGHNLAHDNGKRDRDGARTAPQIEGAFAPAETVPFDDEIDCRPRVGRAEPAIILCCAGERRAVERSWHPLIPSQRPRRNNRTHARGALQLSAENLNPTSAPYQSPLDNRFADQLPFITSYESLSPKHVYVDANANLRPRATVSGEENDRINHLHS